MKNIKGIDKCEQLGRPGNQILSTLNAIRNKLCMHLFYYLYFSIKRSRNETCFYSNQHIQIKLSKMRLHLR